MRLETVLDPFDVPSLFVDSQRVARLEFAAGD